VKSPARAAALAVTVNASLLLGCTALQSLQGGTQAKKPAASPTATAAAATASPTAAPGAALTDRINKIGSEMNTGFKDAGKRLDDRSSAPARAIDAITPAQERAIGQAASFSIIQQSGGLVLEEGLVRYVNQLANYVASNGERTEKGKDGVARIKARRFFVGILDSESMNAYALPGGYLLVTRGLLENLSCESDLAWVLGHEIAHVDAEHGLKALKGVVGGSTFLKEWTGTTGESSLDNPAFFAKLVDKLTDITYKAGLQAKDERVADTTGLELSVKAGYDSAAPKRVLELLATNPAKWKPFASHDAPAARVQLLGPVLDKAPSGKLGLERFEKECIARIDGVKRAAITPAP
jgi:beta-barrel assembly-enhancing protease